MIDRLKIYIGQINPTIGALSGNQKLIEEFYAEALTKGADYALLSELVLTGYSVRDMVLRPKFLEDVANHVDQIAKITQDTMLGFGAPVFENDKIYNAYFYCQNGVIKARVLKTHLPDYACFDEKRIFEPGEIPSSFGEVVKINTAICEDVWHQDFGEAIKGDVDILFVPNASPYERGKLARRHEVVRERAKQIHAPIVYVHMNSLEDELIFDGGSFVMSLDGEVTCQLPQFENVHAMIEMERGANGWRVADAPMAEITDEWEADYRAMVEGLQGYAQKTGFSRAVLGLSGGIDSALVAAIASDALGPENVDVLMMPSRYTSQASLDDADDCAKRLGIKIDDVSISPAVDAISGELASIFGGDPEGLTAENIQPRLRATFLMAVSNSTHSLLLTTGNKSEVAVGYATLYGDMAGGYNPLKDLYKMRVFETCRWRNQNHRSWMKGRVGEVIPPQIISKPPTAELKPDQKDSDSLPEYEILDAILEMMIDEDHSVKEIVRAGYEEEVVKNVQRLIFIAEYKRYQAAPGVKLTKRHFGTDRRYPIINHWRDEG